MYKQYFPIGKPKKNPAPKAARKVITTVEPNARLKTKF